MRIQMPAMPKIQLPAIFGRKPEPKPVALTTIQKVGQFFKNCCCLPCSLCGRAKVEAPAVKPTLSQKVFSTLSSAKNYVVAHKKEAVATVALATVATAGYVKFDAIKGAVTGALNSLSQLVYGEEETSFFGNVLGKGRELVVNYPAQTAVGVVAAGCLAKGYKKTALTLVGAAALAQYAGYMPKA